MKRITLVLSLFIIVFSLSSCIGTDYDKLLSNNEAIQGEITSLQNQNSDLSVLLENVQAQLVTEQTALLVLLEDIQAKQNLQGDQLDNLDIIQEELDMLLIELTTTQVDLYLEYGDYSEDYVLFFRTKTAGLIEDGMTKDEVILKFNSEFSISGISALNDDLSTSSVITLSKPLVNDYEQVNVSVYYHNELLQSYALDTASDFILDFAAPNYGMYTVITEMVYQDVTFEEEFNFGVTSSHYNMAFLNATKPVLMYTAEHLTVQSEFPTFIQIVRLKTFNWDKLPENTFGFPEFIPNNGLITDGIDALSKWIYELYLADTESTFELNIVDNYTGIAIVAFDRYHIPEENWNVNIWTDGAFTEYTLNSYTSEAILNERISFIENYRKEAFNVPTETINYDYVNANVNKHALAYAVSLDNVHYYTDGLDGIIVTDQVVLDAIDAKITVKSIPDLFTALKASGNIDDFEYLLKTKWGEAPEDSMSYYFDSPKGKYVLILGTSPNGENSNSSNKYFTFDEYLQQVKTLFGTEYEVFYKGHPAYPSSTERKALFVDEGIIELEKTIPVEVLMYIYPNVYIGGYSGSSFYSSQDGQTLFFYGAESYVRGRETLANMMDDTTIFDNTVFLFDEEK